VLADPLTRWLLLAGLVMTLVLLTVSTLVIPSRTSISLGFSPSGVPLAPVPASQLLLIPVLCIILFIADLIGGLYFYRKPENRPVAFVLWIAALVMQVLLFVALGFILFR
jgi:hypothetical protein